MQESLHARLRRAAAGVRHPRRPLRPAPDAARSASSSSRSRRRWRRSRRPATLLIAGARRAGRRRGDDAAHDAVADQRHLPRPRARHRLRGLGFDDRRHGRRRPAARRLADHRLLLALGIRHQRAARHHHHRRRAAHRRRIARPHGRRRIDVVGALPLGRRVRPLVFGLIEGRTLRLVAAATRRRRRLDLAVRDLAHPVRASPSRVLALVAFVLWATHRQRRRQEHLLALRPVRASRRSATATSPR